MEFIVSSSSSTSSLPKTAQELVCFQDIELIQIGWVVVAGVTGGVGLAAIYFQAFDTWLCHHFGCYFGGSGSEKSIDIL